MSQTPNRQSPQDQLRAMTRNWKLAPILYAITELEIADHLADSPKTVTELAELTDTHAPSLYRLLRAVVTIDLFHCNEMEQFDLTPLSNVLRKDVENSMRKIILWNCSPMFWRSWGELLHTLSTGEVAFQHAYGKGFFEHLDANPADSELFNVSMTRMTTEDAETMLTAFDFSEYTSVVDIGGGHGTLITAILQRYEDLHGAIFDLPQVVEGTQAIIESEGLSDRCQVIGGDFFQQVVSGYGLYIMKDIVHDWDDVQAIRILQKTHEAMSENARLLIMERIVPPNNEMHGSKWVDLTMMLVTGGKERTREEYQALLSQAGFEITRIIPTDAAYSIIETKPV